MATINIQIKAEGKGRPKFTTRGGYVKAYTPKKTRYFEELVAKEWIEQTNGLYFDDEPIRVEISAFYDLPKSASKRERRLLEESPRPRIKKPDIDNIEKAILDGLNGVAFADDKQVCQVTKSKWDTTSDSLIIKVEKIESW